ncbi:MAG TPA: helicase-related protein [Anaerolineae bacterium]|nr:helicase-related protein [Anaerolineae bacterium]
MSDWLFSRSLAQSVRVVERVELWGQQQARVWDPARNEVLLLPASDLASPDGTEPQAVHRLLSVIAAARIREALAGETLAAPLDASVIPLPHQLRALARATSDDRIRFLLADEVGLGKTIEAGLILRELKLRGLARRTLVVAPKGIVLQWVEEMRTHFRETFRLIQPADLMAFERTAWDTNPWERFEQAVVSMDAVKPIEERRGWTAEQVARHNQTRFEDLLAAGWDLIVVDEAHRIAGSSESVARYQLGKGLTAAAPYLLLLSATPHSGKSDAFRRLMNLLDPDDFPLTIDLDRERVAPYVIRTEKRRAVDADGRPLFQPRHTRLLPVQWGAPHRLQQQLYDAVTEYVRDGYNRARLEKRNAVGFLLLLMQRLVASSTRAIRAALERRLDVLRQAQDDGTPADDLREWEAEWLESDSQEQLDEIIARAAQAREDEREEVERLLSLARQCEAARPDAKAEALLDLLTQLEREESDPALKFLIFTEFVSTQAMLGEFLADRGYSVVCLNGSMDLDERRQAQRDFAAEARVLLSTDAGGEGLNLQVAHVAINYDIPWSPTKIEQRIGRVDRIGQTRPVRAFNFAIEDSVDHRVQEVLARKLAVILAEFGVDKTSDILDSAEAEADFDQLYREALLHPEQIEQEVDRLVESIRQRTAEARGAFSLFGDDAPIDPSAAARIQSHPLQLWVESATVNDLRAEGWHVLQTANGYDVRRGAREAWGSIRFRARPGRAGEGEDRADAARVIGLDDERVQSLLNRAAQHVPGQPIPVWSVSGLAEGVSGIWSLWRVSLIAGESRASRVFPLFVHDDGRLLMPSARHVWDVLASPGTPIQEAGVETDGAAAAYERIAEVARREGERVYHALLERHRARLQREREKGEYSFEARRAAIDRIGLANVRQKRLSALAADETRWADDLRRQSHALPDLEAVIFVKVTLPTLTGNRTRKNTDEHR